MNENETLKNNISEDYIKSVKLAKIHYSDSKSFWFGFLCFFQPFVGFFSYLVWKEDRPKRAKSCLTGALIGFFVSVLLVLTYIAIVIYNPEIFDSLFGA